MSNRQTGTVKWWNDQKRFGFITPQDGSGDVFVEYRSIVSGGMLSLAEGQVVSFEIGNGPRGRQAVEVQ